MTVLPPEGGSDDGTPGLPAAGGGSGRPSGLASEQALSRRRKVLLLGALALGLPAALGTVADLLQVIDTLSSVDHPVLGAVTCSVLIAIPLVSAAIYFLPHNRAIFVFCFAGVSMAVLGALYGGRAIERAGHESPAAAIAAGETVGGGHCSTKVYGGDPSVLQECRRVELAEGQQLDLDERGMRAVSKPRGPDVKLVGGSLTPVDDAELAVLNSAVMTQATYPISYPGCERAKRGSTAISVRDLTERMAVCAKTSGGRIAILWLVDYDDDQQSVVLVIRCWRQAPS